MFDFLNQNKGKKKKQQVKKNKRRGKSAEEIAKSEDRINGWEIIDDNGKGYDYKVKRRNPFTGKTEEKTVEVKSGNAELSELQKKTKRKHEREGKKYEVKRREPLFW